MKIVHIQKQKAIRKTEKEIKREGLDDNQFPMNIYKYVELKQPIYVVEMSMEELQLVNFYLELEKRKPIINMEIGEKNEV